tara:strand:- start:330 stop:926 length:597 start_codon:yes stop_codon:yes gene_type:complete
MKALLLYLAVLPYISFGQFMLTDLLKSFEESDYEDVLFSNACNLTDRVNEKVKVSHFINDYHHLSDWEYSKKTFECEEAIYEIESQKALIMEKNWYKTIVIYVPKNGSYYSVLLNDIKKNCAFRGLKSWQTESKEESNGFKYFLTKEENSKIYKGFFISIIHDSNAHCLEDNCYEIRVSAKGWQHATDMSKLLLEKIK